MDRTQQLLAFLYQTPVAIIEINSSGEVGLMNAVASQYLMPLTGGKRVENLVTLLQPFLPDLPSRLSRFALSSGLIYDQERFSVDGKVYRFTLRRVTEDLYMAVLSDITEEVRREDRIQSAVVEEAEQRSKSEIAAGVLHDIGNAITGLGTAVARSLGELNWSELETLGKLRHFLADRSTDLAGALGEEKSKLLLRLLEELEESLAERQKDQGDRMKRMAATLSHVSEILTIQRQYTADRSVGRDRSVDLRRAIDDAVEMQRSSFSSREVRVERHYPDEPVRVRGDRTKLVRVVMNLLRNSAEAFDRLESEPADGRNVTIVVSCTHESAVVKVADNGPGVDETTGPGGHSSKGKAGGLGLRGGAAIVEAHGGGLELRSGEAGGAEARLWLPLLKGE